MTTQVYYYWKQETGNIWIGLSVAHNKREERIVERYINQQIKISKAKTLYKKEKNKEIIKRWN
jgi:hypothetical protein